MKAFERSVAVFVLLTGLSVALAAQTPPSLAGTFQITAVGQPLGKLTFLLTLKQTGQQWSAEFRESPMPITVRTVSVDGTQLSIAALSGNASLQITGKYETGLLAGEWQTSDAAGVWVGARPGNEAQAAAKLAQLEAALPARSDRPANQFAQDFTAGEVPTTEELTSLERAAAARPEDFRLARKLGKGYFFQVFGAGSLSFIPKGLQSLERALALKKDDAETLAYLGALTCFHAQKLEQDSQKQMTGFQRCYQLSRQAEQLEPNSIAVLSVVSVTYLNFPESMGLAPKVAALMERVRQQLGPLFGRMSHHGQQRILLTQGQAYARMSQPDKARACFEEGLKLNADSVEAALLKAELEKLKARS